MTRQGPHGEAPHVVRITVSAPPRQEFRFTGWRLAIACGVVLAAVEWVTSQPRHVNVNLIELMPVVQSFGALPVDRSE